MALNHIQITNAKPKDKAYKLADADGLYLVIQPNGTKLWRMNYRHLGRQKTLYFGAWPTVEASRAGDAGRGFAIVAQEIKSLATQSGTSVDDISQKIVAVQVAIAATIDANRAIRDTVADVRSFVARASDTISQQADTTATIISAVDDTGSAAEAIESTITDMRSNADDVTREIGALREAFDLLSRRLIELQAAAQAYVQAS